MKTRNGMSLVLVIVLATLLALCPYEVAMATTGVFDNGEEVTESDEEAGEIWDLNPESYGEETMAKILLVRHLGNGVDVYYDKVYGAVGEENYKPIVFEDAHTLYSLFVVANGVGKKLSYKTSFNYKKPEKMVVTIKLDNKTIAKKTYRFKLTAKQKRNIKKRNYVILCGDSNEISDFDYTERRKKGSKTVWLWHKAGFYLRT